MVHKIPSKTTIKQVTGGWEFDRSHGAGTSSPSYRQRVEEQALTPVGWMMCFLLMTFVPVQKLCLNIPILIYTYAFFVYMSSVIGRIYAYTRSVVQYWWSCAPSQSIGLYVWECAVPGSNATFSSFFLVVVVVGVLPIVSMINSLILGCLWP